MPEMKSNFASTCNRLSQFIKEKKSSLADLGDLGIAHPRPATALCPPTAKSMELFPQCTGFGPSASAAANFREPKKSQLTIFYGGKVLVFDNFPKDKAMDLVQMAGKASFTAPNLSSAEKPPQPSVSFLPMARKLSLHRFLEKRKDRIQAKSPYQANESTMKKVDERESWLGLGPQISSKPGLSSESS